MKKKIIIIIGAIILLIIIKTSIFLLVAKSNTPETKIRSVIKKANYCDIDSDCIYIGNKCPFYCNIYVNKNEVNQISKLIESFNSKCAYRASDCEICPTAICKNNKCKMVCE